jgi:hypothetical protein
MDRQRMDAACDFRRQNRINHAVAVNPALPAEGLGYDIDSEMGLPARPMPSMTFVLMRFIDHPKAFWRESLGQLICDMLLGSHAAA